MKNHATSKLLIVEICNYYLLIAAKTRNNFTWLDTFLMRLRHLITTTTISQKSGEDAAGGSETFTSKSSQKRLPCNFLWEIALLKIDWPVRLAKLDLMRKIKSDAFDSQYIDQK